MIVVFSHAFTRVFFFVAKTQNDDKSFQLKDYIKNDITSW